MIKKGSCLALVVILLAFTITGCSSTGTKKVVVDSSSSKPGWVDKPILSWEDKENYYFKANYSIKGNERLNGCYTLAQGEIRERVLRGIYDEVKGAIDTAQMSLNENAEIVLSKVQSGKYEGVLYGLQDAEEYFERYDLCNKKDCTQRIDCWRMAKMTTENYNKTKHAIVDKIAEADPRIKEAITKKAINFFSEPSNAVTGQDTTASKGN